MSNAKGQKPFLITEQASRRPVVVVEAEDADEALLRATAVVRMLGVKPGNYLWEVRLVSRTEAIQAPFFADGFFKVHKDKLIMNAKIVELPRAHAN